MLRPEYKAFRPRSGPKDPFGSASQKDLSREVVDEEQIENRKEGEEWLYSGSRSNLPVLQALELLG